MEGRRMGWHGVGRAAPLAAALLALGGCISFGPKVPDTLIRLEPAEMAPPGQGTVLDRRRSITVVLPTAPNPLTVNRVPVRSGAAALSYLKDAQYADAPPRLFRELLAETIRARTGRAVLDLRDHRLAPGAKLFTRVARFGVDADRREVEMLVDCAFVPPTLPGQTIPPATTTRRFEARVPVAAIDAATVSPALGQAANGVAAQIADWIGR